MNVICQGVVHVECPENLVVDSKVITGHIKHRLCHSQRH